LLAVHVVHFGNGFQCVAVFVVHQSPIRSFALTNATRACVASEDGLVGKVCDFVFEGECILDYIKYSKAVLSRVT
jgi:hypothetical protein